MAGLQGRLEAGDTVPSPRPALPRLSRPFGTDYT